MRIKGTWSHLSGNQLGTAMSELLVSLESRDAGVIMVKAYSRFVLIFLLTLFFASCGGGGGGGSGFDPHMPGTATDDINTDVSSENSLPSEADNGDIQSDEPLPDENLYGNHHFGPEFGESLSLYHAILVMRVLQLLSTSSGGFAGIDIGQVNPLSFEFSEYIDELTNDEINGGRLSCIYGSEQHGDRTVTWNNGGPDYPAQFTSTRIYNNCMDSGVDYGDLRVYDGTLIQSGGLSRRDAYDVIQGGHIHADQLMITDDISEVSVTMDGYIDYSYNLNGQWDTEISEIGLTIHEDSSFGYEEYSEDIRILSGQIIFGDLVYETPEGRIHHDSGIRHASVRIDVENNNHRNIALLVQTVPKNSDDTVYSLEISRAELSDHPQTTHHSIRIDRMLSEFSGHRNFNVYMDLNENGVIDTADDTYPKEFYEADTLQTGRWTRWGYMGSCCI